MKVRIWRIVLGDNYLIHDCHAPNIEGAMRKAYLVQTKTRTDKKMPATRAQSEIVEVRLLAESDE